LIFVCSSNACIKILYISLFQYIKVPTLFFFVNHTVLGRNEICYIFFYFDTLKFLHFFCVLTMRFSGEMNYANLMFRCDHVVKNCFLQKSNSSSLKYFHSFVELINYMGCLVYSCLFISLYENCMSFLYETYSLSLVCKQENNHTPF